MADIEHPDFNPDKLDNDQLIANPMKTLEEVKKYLDECIVFWRKIKKNTKDWKMKEKAEHYIDAFQSARVSIFGYLLPE